MKNKTETAVMNNVHEGKLKILQYIADAGEMHWETLHTALADHLGLTAEEWERLDERRRTPRFRYELFQLLHELAQEGLLEVTREQRYYRLTERGLAVLQHPPETLTSDFWAQFKLPTVDTILPVFLRLLADGEPHPYLEVRDSLTRHFRLTAAQQRATNPHSGLAWNRRWGDAGRALARVNFITLDRGVYRIDELGSEVLQTPPPRIDTAFLETFQRPMDELTQRLLQQVADKGPRPRERLIADLVACLRTDTYPSGEQTWTGQCHRAMWVLEQKELVSTTGEGSFRQITPLGQAVRVMEPEQLSSDFIKRLERAAALLNR